ncbi:MAG: hypothetical protein GX559_00670 [Candidatus Pacebacteria bacterium]|nr:hypothetical protein [Candidatus Paceibacterota bacterium]
MSDEKIKQKQLDVPANYYFFGDPGRVLDRVEQLLQLDNADSAADQRLALAVEVLSFCPVPFLDELITALDSQTRENVINLRNKASKNEINLRTQYWLSEEETSQVSASALHLLSEKIINSKAEEILPILRFVQQYIKDQNELQELTNSNIDQLSAEIKRLSEEIEKEKLSLEQDQVSLAYDFAVKLSQWDI